MPSKSPAQARMMAGAAHNPAFAAKVGVPMATAKEFNTADKGKGKIKSKKGKGKKRGGKSKPFPPRKSP